MHWKLLSRMLLIHNLFVIHAGSLGEVRHDVDGERHDHLPVPLAADGLLSPGHIRRSLPDIRAGQLGR